MAEACMYCGKDQNEQDIYFRAIYHPFDDEPTTEGFICDYCSDDIYYCEVCNREIYEGNGYRRNIRFNENEGIICVKCLQERWFVEGMEKFKDGDWFLDKDLLEHGFVRYDSYFCNYMVAEKDFITLQEAGNLAIVSITASGMGLEHHFDIWIKPKKKKYSVELAIDSLEQCIENNDFDIITLDRIQYTIEILKDL